MVLGVVDLLRFYETKRQIWDLYTKTSEKIRELSLEEGLILINNALKAIPETKRVEARERIRKVANSIWESDEDICSILGISKEDYLRAGGRINDMCVCVLASVELGYIRIN